MPIFCIVRGWLLGLIFVIRKSYGVCKAQRAARKSDYQHLEMFIFPFTFLSIFKMVFKLVHYQLAIILFPLLGCILISETIFRYVNRYKTARTRLNSFDRVSLFCEIIISCFLLVSTPLLCRAKRLFHFFFKCVC